MKYFPSAQAITQQTIIMVVSLVLAGLIISQIPAVKQYTSQVYNP